MDGKGPIAFQEAQATAERLLANLERVIFGKVDEERLAVMALMCRGHVLIEGVPGVGKTMLARALARSVGGTFHRIQLTSDLLPGDVTGVSVYNPKTSEFEFRPGPIMANVVLADEINRASPKTQAALLEAMEERQVSVDGVTYPLPEPFILLATQNPIEYEGTFPLPETELDRFTLRLTLGYPTSSDEVRMLEAHRLSQPIDDLEQVVSLEEMLRLQEAVRAVHVDRRVQEYIVAIVQASRRHSRLYLGASPRGSLALLRLAQARALLEHRDFCLPDDVKAVAEPALAHRVILHSAARIEGSTAASAIADVLSEVPVPGATPV